MPGAQIVRVARDFPPAGPNRQRYEKIYARFTRLRQAGNCFYLNP